MPASQGDKLRWRFRRISAKGSPRSFAVVSLPWCCWRWFPVLLISGWHSRVGALLLLNLFLIPTT